MDDYRLNAVPPLGGVAYHNFTRAQFASLAQAQLNELMDIWEEGAGDDEAFEVWFDGGAGPFNDTVGPVVRNRTRLAGGAGGRRRGVCHSCFPFTQDDDVGELGRGCVR